VEIQQYDREAPARRTLTVRTVKVPDPGDLLVRLPDLAPSAWIHRGDGLVGWGEAARLTIPAGADRFEIGARWLDQICAGGSVTDEVGMPGTGLSPLAASPSIPRLAAPCSSCPARSWPGGPAWRGSRR
jgi:hypothetical protein